MSFLRRMLNRVVGPIARPFLAWIRQNLAASGPTVEDRIRFDLTILATARSVAASGRHRVVLPTDGSRPRGLEALRIGFFGNLANNAYNFTKCLRRAGHDAELVVEDEGFDTFLMNRPFWEDVEVECGSYEEGLAHERRWSQPAFVRRVVYDQNLGARLGGGRLSAVPEVQARYKEAFGLDLPADRALLLAQQMAHWPMLLAMQRYDVVQLSGAHIALGPFCPKPYVVFPTGSDLFISPFEESLTGLLQRTGYRSADHVLLCETNYPAYLDRIDQGGPRSFSPLMVDTDAYAPGTADALRAKWSSAVGGTRFLVSVCRQSWQWKGNDRLLRAFAGLEGSFARDWRLVLLSWGPDVERSRALMSELGIEKRVIWEPLCSKPLLKFRQQAADLVADQFVMEGYGTSVLEAMAAGKAVVMAPAPPRSRHHLAEPPPFFGAVTIEEIGTALRLAADDRERERRGSASLAWVRKHHGHEATIAAYLHAYRAAALGMEPHAPSAGEVPRVPASEVSWTPPGDLGPSRALWEQLAALHVQLRERFMERFDRSLPFADELTDRWERARYLGFGEKSSIYDSALVLGDVRVGTNTWIGPQCLLDGSGGLEIGSNCSIATGAHLYSHDTVEWAVSGGVRPYRRAATRIGDACYIGPHAIVAAGASIGSNCIVGALSLVKGDVADHTFVGGVPAKILGRVEVGTDAKVTIIYEVSS